MAKFAPPVHAPATVERGQAQADSTTSSLPLIGGFAPAIFKGGSGATVFTGTEARAVMRDMIFPATQTAFLSAASNLTATASGVFGATAPLTAQSSLTATAVKVAVSTSPLTAQSTLTATAAIVYTGTSTLTGQSTLTATAVKFIDLAAAPTAQSTLTATAVYVQPATSALSADSTLTADATIPFSGPSSILTAQSTLTATARQSFASTTALTAQSTLLATAIRVQLVTSALTALSTLNAPSASAFKAAQAVLSANLDMFSGAIGVLAAYAQGLSDRSDLYPPAAKRLARKFYWDSLSNEYEQGRRYRGKHNWLAHNVGVTLFRRDGVWHEQLNAVDYDLAGADRVYRGGRTYELDALQQSELIAAGYGSGIRVAFEEAN